MKMAATMKLYDEEKNYFVVSTRVDSLSRGKLGTGDSRVIHRNLTKQDAERASLAMPFTKVVKGPLPEEDPEIRKKVRRKLIESHPDLD